MNLKHWFGLSIAFALVGCSGTPSAPSSGTSPSTSQSSGTTGSATGSTNESKPAPRASIGELPENLKNEAFHWYGLANTNPVKLRCSLSDGRKFDGTQMVSLESIEGGKATFTIDRTEGLETLFGDETVTLEKDGVYTIASSKLKGDTRNLEMPSDVHVGSSWQNAAKLETNDERSTESNQKYRVARIENVKTPIGVQSAMLIVSDGDARIQGVSYRMETHNWYVRDKGIVKAEVRLTETGKAKAKAQVVTIEVAK